MKENLNTVWYRVRKTIRIPLLIILLFFIVVMPGYSIIMGQGRLEAISFMEGIILAEWIHHEEKGGWSESFDEIAFSGEKPGEYIYFISPTESLGDLPDNSVLGLPIDFESMGAPLPGPTDNGFIVVAIGNIDFDNTLDVLWMDQNKKITIVNNDTDYAGNFIDLIKWNY